MLKHNIDKRNGTITTQVVCAVLFCLFSFSWLYWFQADVLAVAQHVLSGGQTHYNRLVGAVLITLLLLALQLLVAMVVRLRRRTHALTYLPSMLLLAMLCSVQPGSSSRLSPGYWWWLAPTILLVWLVLVWLARQMMPFDQDKEPTGFFSRRVWLNMLQMSFLMLGVAALSNTHAVFHFRAHAETALLRGNTNEALRVGYRSHETDVHLTMLRAYVLSRSGQLANHLFDYPIAGRGADLLPMPASRSRLLMLPADSIFALCGGRPVNIHTTAHYYEVLERDSMATPAVADYRLCGLLIDKKIDDFVRQLLQYYEVSDALPRHYREALTLYTHLRSLPVVVYHHAVMDEDWADFHRLEEQYADKRQRKERMANRYSGSYWYYYFYE